MKKSQLVTGMAVEIRNGEHGLVIGERIVFNDGYLNISIYEEDLTVGEEMLEKYVIDKIYYLKNEKNGLQYLDWFTKKLFKQNLIWEREKIDWTKIEKDTLIIVNVGGIKRVRYFCEYKDNKVIYFAKGASSITIDKDAYIKKHCASTEEVRLYK